MKTAKGGQAGYTIFEVMIFLIISSALLVSAVGLFGPRVSSTQFNQAVQELSSRLRSVSSQSATGTYYDGNNFNCSVNSGLPTVAVGTDTQGARNACIFLGKIVNFTVAGSPNNIDIYTVMGRRETSSGVSATSIAEANPKLMLPIPDNVTETFQLGSGTHVTGAYRVDSSGATTPVSAIGFFQTFGGAYVNGNLSSGAQSIVIGTIGTAAPSSALDINGSSSSGISVDTSTSTNILICAQAGGGDKKTGIELSTSSITYAATTTPGDSRCP